MHDMQVRILNTANICFCVVFFNPFICSPGVSEVKDKEKSNDSGNF